MDKGGKLNNQEQNMMNKQLIPNSVSNGSGSKMCNITPDGDSSQEYKVYNHQNQLYDMQLKLGNANEMVYPSSSSHEKLGERNNVSSANGSISGADDKSYHTAY